jgi:hypothetical protein
MINNDKNLSAWLPPSEVSSRNTTDLESLEQALRWLGAEVNQDSDKPVIKKPPTPAIIATKQEFNETIFRVFGGEPKRVVPRINHSNDRKPTIIYC